MKTKELMINLRECPSDARTLMEGSELGGKDERCGQLCRMMTSLPELKQDPSDPFIGTGHAVAKIHTFEIDCGS